MTLKQASTRQWARQAQKQLPPSPWGLRVINQQLWCCCRAAGIVVFDSELQQQRIMLTDNMSYVRDVAAMSNGDVVIAAQNGLYHANKNGRAVVIFASLRKTRSMQATYL